MTRSLVTLARTKMRGGLCVAGLDIESGTWVRPVKAFGNIQWNDVRYADGTPLALFDQSAFGLVKARPQPPHNEDWVCDFVRPRLTLEKRLTEAERADFLARHADADPAPLLSRQERSLLLLDATPYAETLGFSFTIDAPTNRLDARLHGLTPALLPITDLNWRAMGRVHFAETSGRLLPWAELRARWQTQCLYLVLGLSREFDGKIWTLIVGIHCVPALPPDWQTPLDFRFL